MSSDGTGVTKLTTKPSSQMPAYSPDGQRIAFVRGDNVYTMNASGGGEVRLTTERGSQAWPNWQPLPGGRPGGHGGSGGFRIGKPIFDRRHGTAKLPVTVPGGGLAQAARPQGQAPGRKVRRGLHHREAAGQADGDGPPRRWGRSSQAKVKVLVTYRPAGGGTETKAKSFKLRKNPSR